MGTITSKDTRRISFDNTFALSPALSVQNSIEDENVMVFDNIATETSSEFLFNDNNTKNSESQEDGEIDYWARRIEYLKKEHQIINKIIETEYNKKIESTNKVFEPPKITHERIQKIKPCIDWRAKIMQCYQDNPHQPLMCSAIVQAFRNCVTSCRIED